MAVEFHSDLLRYLAQSRDGKHYVEVLDIDFFELDVHGTVFSLLKNFVKKYNGQPSVGNLLQFFETEAKAQKEPISAQVRKLIDTGIRDMFKPYKSNTEQLKEVVIQNYQVKLLKDTFKKNASKLKDGGSEVIEEVYKEVARIKRIGETDLDAERNRGEFLLQDYVQGNYSITEGHPTCYEGLNRLTSVGGFFSPQLTVMMGGPKSFKTGTLLSIALGYVRDGYKVYYADAENGHTRLRDRMRQAMLGVTASELYSGDYDEVLTQIVDKYKTLGGEFRADFYPAHTKSINDVEAELDYLKDEFGWEPDLICYDYLDLFKPVDYRIKEKRLQIQAVYFDAIRLQHKRGIFGFTLSQVSRNAVGKQVITMTDFAEDFGKAANAHAGFALCRDEVEEAAGLMRIVPVMQRDGVKSGNHAVFCSVDEAKMDLKEIGKAEWRRVYALYENQPNEKKEDLAGRKKRLLQPKKLNDV